MTDPVKKKKYSVEVRSFTNARMTVFANSKKEAYEIAERDMSESLERMLENQKPHPFLSRVTGYTDAIKSSVEIIK